MLFSTRDATQENRNIVILFVVMITIHVSFTGYFIQLFLKTMVFQMVPLWNTLEQIIKIDVQF